MTSRTSTSLSLEADPEVVAFPLGLLRPAWLVIGAEIARAPRVLSWIELERGRAQGAAFEPRSWLGEDLPALSRWLGAVELVNVERLDASAWSFALRGAEGATGRVRYHDRAATRTPLLRVRLGARTFSAWTRSDGRDELVVESAGGEQRVSLSPDRGDETVARVLAAAAKGRAPVLMPPGEIESVRAVARRILAGAGPGDSLRAALGEVLLVQLPRRRDRFDQVRLPPLGLARLQAALAPRGFRVRLVDLDAALGFDAVTLDGFADDERVDRWLEGEVDRDLQQRAEELADRLGPLDDVAVLGVSVTDVMSRLQPALAVALARGAKGRKAGLRAIVGGDFEALRPDWLLGHDAVDALVFGDGEGALSDWVQAVTLGDRPLERVEGLWRRESGGVVQGRRARVRFSERAVPDFAGVPLEAYRRGPSPELAAVLRRDHPGLASRSEPLLFLPYYFVEGCSAKCVFCSWGTYLDVQDPAKSAREVVELADRHGTDCFYLLDTTVNVSRRALEGFVEGLLRSGRRLLWTDSARPHLLDDDLARGMAEAGCVMLSYGVESGSDAVLARMKKGFTAAEAGASLQAAHRAGILNRVNLIAGFFHEDDADVEATQRFVTEHRDAIDVVGCFQGFYLFPGMDVDASVLGLTLHDGFDTLPLGQRTVTWDEHGGLDWARKREQIRTSHERVKATLDACGIYGRDKIDDYDVFHLARLFADKATRKRLLLEAARLQEAP
jgi:radical SAM superfamily enzyme YgiQ (UPF0313 family)